ncbi:UDP-N-acetylmuramate--L-alanine ligase [Urechidicola vernalis]|uniref:UDP-N-acetylmuramate--L-alanine ligase n=1 Tax=Urechidicola vernalis TaxID=3075600 RepID=A0ABU2Y3X5_9FLAO|nr:UDP-N-acetylmuramate--L-alanine ligase [Urechidicola sp. P050]MDT0552906.1 UDP-N-acetylmuramate--L-alanine ligase [Urechidicola sp. P050]
MELNEFRNIYFIGIGGIGMSALARYFSVNGKNVSGYDKTASPITDGLEEIGITIHFEDDIENVADNFKDALSTVVVYTPAVPSKHKELNYFFNNGFTVLKRSEMLGVITKNTRCMAVAGTHGKTTTSTILGHIMKECGTNATSFLGGISENYNSNLILGGSEISVVEADEYDRSFLMLSPDIACVTSMDEDHLDIYSQKNALEESFIEFANKVSDKLIVRKGLPLEGLTYAIEEKADYYADNLKIKEGSYIFDVMTPTEIIRNVEFNLPGKHNVLNAVAALAMANYHGVSLRAIAKALLSFKGIKRRFTYKIQTDNLVLIDDYAHHPTELNAVENAVREMYPLERVMAIFQPHLFSRTKDFADDFGQSLSKFDEVLLLDIYPAREKPIEGITSSWLLDKINCPKKKLSTKEELIQHIKESDAKVKMLLGAGDIGQLVEGITKDLLGEN